MTTEDPRPETPEPDEPTVSSVAGSTSDAGDGAAETAAGADENGRGRRRDGGRCRRDRRGRRRDPGRCRGDRGCRCHHRRGRRRDRGRGCGSGRCRRLLAARPARGGPGPTDGLGAAAPRASALPDRRPVRPRPADRSLLGDPDHRLVLPLARAAPPFHRAGAVQHRRVRRAARGLDPGPAHGASSRAGAIRSSAASTAGTSASPPTCCCWPARTRRSRPRRPIRSRSTSIPTPGSTTSGGSRSWGSTSGSCSRSRTGSSCGSSGSRST